MTQNTRTARVLLQYQLDQGSLQQTLAANRALSDSLQQQVTISSASITAQQQVTEASLQAAIATQEQQASISLLVDAVSKGEIATGDLVAQLNALGATKGQIDQVASALANVSSASAAANQGSVGGGLTSQRRGFSALGSLVGSQLGGGALGDVSRIISVGAAFGVAGVAIGAIGLVLQTVTKQADATTKELVDSANAYYQVADAARGATNAQLKDQLKQSLGEADFAKAFLDQQQLNLDNYLRANPGINAPVVGAIAELIEGKGGTLGGLKQNVDDAKAAFDKAQTAAGALAYTQDTGANAAAELAASEKLLADERLRQQTHNKQIVDDTANTQTQLSQLRRSGSSDQVQAELDANHDRQTIIQTYLIPNYKLLGLSLTSLAAEFGKLSTVDNELTQSVLPVLAAREAETKLLADQKSQSDALNSVLQDINKTQVDLAAASQKTADALTAVGQAETDHANNLQTIQQTYDTAQQDALSKKNIQLAKIDQQAAERRLQERENDNLSILQAVARGDLASAQATLAQQKVKDTQDQRQIAQQKADAQQNYTDALAQAKAQNVKLLASEQDRYTKELNQRRDAYNKAYQDQQALDNQLQSLRDQQTAITRYWISTTVVDMYKITDATDTLSASVQAYQDRVNADIQARTISGQSGGSAGGATVGSGSGTGETPGSGSPLPPVTGTGASKRTITQYALGTNYVPFDMDAHIHKGEAIIPAGQNSRTMIFQVGDADLAAKIVAAVKPVVEAHGEKVKVEVVQGLTAIHQGQKH